MARFVHVRPKLIAAALLTAAIALPRPPARDTSLSVTAVRFWSLNDVTRIAIETTGEFQFSSDRVPNPDRVYFDIAGARSRIGARGARTILINDPRVRQIRVAQTQTSVTRIVLDLEPSVEVTSSRLPSPDRLIIEVRSSTGTAPPAVAPIAPAAPLPLPASPLKSPVTNRRPTPFRARQFVAPAPEVLVARAPDPLPFPPLMDSENFAPLSISLPEGKAPAPPRRTRARVVAENRSPRPAPTAAEVAGEIARDTTRPSGTILRGNSRRTSTPEESVPHAASKNSDGARSMTRVLGLKVGRIVIDPGHGGHDTGTLGRNGLVEKDLVLDVARRLGKLITERMGSEVVFTRSDDTFIPLETRTAIANERRADLFLSIHANSSPIRSIAGVETFYLNFSTSRSDLDVASRENASSQKNVYELKDLLQKIALQDKVEESKEFAARVQASLYSLSSRTAKQRNRGVKKAPFVVLIGAQMPSILAEIGFVSNPREEALMNRPEHRQKIAEALYKGVAQYAGTLSHFQIAQTGAE